MFGIHYRKGLNYWEARNMNKHVTRPLIHQAMSSGIIFNDQQMYGNGSLFIVVNWFSFAPHFSTLCLVLLFKFFFLILHILLLLYWISEIAWTLNRCLSGKQTNKDRWHHVIITIIIFIFIFMITSIDWSFVNCKLIESDWTTTLKYKCHYVLTWLSRMSLLLCLADCKAIE